MKILAINGSPNRNGSTAMLIDMLLEACRGAGAECDRVNLEDYVISACRKCNKCTRTNRCVNDDDYVQLKAKMLDADGIILGSPYYGGNPTDEVIAFLDKVSVTEASNRPFRNKYIVGVSTSAVTNCKGVANRCARLGLTGYVGNGIVSGLVYESIITQEWVKDVESDSDVQATIKKVADKLIKDIQEKREPFSHKLKFAIFNKHLAHVTVRVLNFIDKKFSRFKKYLESKGLIKNPNKME